jgi:hypothetical protein
MPHKISWKFHSMMSSGIMTGHALLALDGQHTPIAMVLHEKEKHKELCLQADEEVCVQLGFPSSCVLCTLETLNPVSPYHQIIAFGLSYPKLIMQAV